MRESKIEKELIKIVKSLKGEAYKFVSPGRRNVPDRLILLPGGSAFFVELKAPGKKATPAQKREHKKLKKLGFTTHVVASVTQAKSVLSYEIMHRTYVANLSDYTKIEF